ncbi:hypothetical protein GGTG_04592 [Gaeumannomyces tritici R3-111a-1]|uniref:Uncharacterized protein n=1 Tax=Gaeumannomyces tritici (strain R3-111a-1) TaxID=644352 RepID=J3NTJ2_GAET3|nr:hypothetical protein GGTG_04592 [Gaeumannomyces tritici R3-111a-1]EJT79508.1 hypothetical protein GGTG_04592 [Gaeumannomyces tritici R3-111a-1]
MPVGSLLRRLTLLGTPRESVVSTLQEPLPRSHPSTGIGENAHQQQRRQLRLHHLHPAARETEFSHVWWTDINWASRGRGPRPTALVVVSLAVSDGHMAAQVGAAVEAIARNLRLRLFAPGLMPHRGVMGETYELAMRLRPEAGTPAEEEERTGRRGRERRRRQSMSTAPGAGGGGAPAAGSSSSSVNTSASSGLSPTTTTTTTSSSHRVVSVVDDYGDTVGEAHPPQPVQMLFFDSRARLRTAEDANVWVVRAFADCLKADTWMPLDHLLGLGPFLSCHWALTYSLGDGAVAAGCGTWPNIPSAPWCLVGGWART